MVFGQAVDSETVRLLQCSGDIVGLLRLFGTRDVVGVTTVFTPTDFHGKLKVLGLSLRDHERNLQVSLVGRYQIECNALFGQIECNAR